jgi:hypothetical protein
MGSGRLWLRFSVQSTVVQPLSAHLFMDRIRTLLLARTHVVVMDPDVIASASTRPSLDADVDKLEDELAQLGFVMSLDLASVIRRMPRQAIQETRRWIHETLAEQMSTARPVVPLAPLVEGAPSIYVRRILTWLATSPEQPCPWCGELKSVGALDPCGHLVCRTCWDDTGYTGCPVCHRRVTLGEPFMKPPVGGARVGKHTGTLTLVHMAFDLHGTAKLRFEKLLGRTGRMSAHDHAEVVTLIDTIGPKIASWLPTVIPQRDAMATAIARLWLISPDRAASVRDTRAHVRSATDVLRIAAVLLGGNAELVEPMKLASISRGLRRAVLSALDQLPLDAVVEDMRAHRSLWKRVGERLHPFEVADKLPNAALAFAVLRRTKLSAISFGAALREAAVRLPFVYVEDDLIKPVAWAGPIEDALRAGNPRSALVRLTHRPAELLRRADHLVRLAQTRQLEALQTILKAVELSATKGPPVEMLALAAHVARRGRPWKRRVFFPRGRALGAWSRLDKRTPLRGDAIAVMVGAIRRQLCARAELNRQFARALIDRGLVDLLVPRHERRVGRAKAHWPRGSEIALPDGQEARLFIDWQDAGTGRTELDLSVSLFDHEWQHVATCNAKSPIVSGRTDGYAARHVAEGCTAMIDLHLEQLTMLGVRHVVMAVASGRRVRVERLPHCFAGVALLPVPEANTEPFDPSAVAQRFDLSGRSLIKVPLTIDVSERRLRWVDVHIHHRSELDEVGGYRAALAHVARDFADQIGTHARPSMWDVACIHAAARANVVYIRERDGTFTTYRRRDNETKTARLGRLMSGAADDGRVTTLPASDAPMWFALLTGMPLPRGSVGFVLDPRGLPAEGIERLAASDLVGELSLRQRDASQNP